MLIVYGDTGGKDEGDVLTVVFMGTGPGTVIWRNLKNDCNGNFQ